MKSTLATICLCLFGFDAICCSFAPGYEEFVPRPDRNIGERVPLTPIVEIQEIKRGYDDGNGGSCSDAGIISIRFHDENPAEKTGYKLAIVGGDFNSHVIPEGIVMPSKFTDEKSMFFVWLDGARNYQEPINFKLEIVAVFENDKESDPFHLEVHHPGGKSN